MGEWAPDGTLLTWGFTVSLKSHRWEGPAQASGAFAVCTAPTATPFAFSPWCVLHTADPAMGAARG